MSTEFPRQLFSTGKDDWATPDSLWLPLNERYHFGIDLAANALNHKCARWFGPGGKAADALVYPWPRDVVCWCNPPYSRGAQSKFVMLAALEAQHGGQSVFLLPARTDTKAFHAYIWDRANRRPHPWVEYVDFLKGRITFIGAPASAPFPSMIVKFGR